MITIRKTPCPDTSIEVNGVAEGSVVAGSSVDIQLSDSLGVVTPISVTQTGNDFAVVLPDAPAAVTRSTATLMKTGQTTSYRTGDDGDIQAGRATDFLTLDTAPVHNDGSATLNTTTARFTDILGGSTYADNIVLDWSTWNGSTLLGWYRVPDLTILTWNDSIDLANSFTAGSFVTGWKLPNAVEIISIYNFSIPTRTNYPPFNITSTLVSWTSTTNPASLGNAYYSSNSTTNPPLAQFLKSNNRNVGFYCRTFSLSTLNVLS